MQLCLIPWKVRDSASLHRAPPSARLFSSAIAFPRASHVLPAPEAPDALHLVPPSPRPTPKNPRQRKNLPRNQTPPPPPPSPPRQPHRQPPQTHPQPPRPSPPASPHPAQRARSKPVRHQHPLLARQPPSPGIRAGGHHFPRPVLKRMLAPAAASKGAVRPMTRKKPSAGVWRGPRGMKQKRNLSNQQRQ
jgi:hypothetical protein